MSWTLLVHHWPSQVRLKVHHRKFVAIEVELLNISDLVYAATMYIESLVRLNESEYWASPSYFC